MPTRLPTSAGSTALTSRLTAPLRRDGVASVAVFDVRSRDTRVRTRPSGAPAAGSSPSRLIVSCGRIHMNWLILPTYDEAENIVRVVSAAALELQRAVPGSWRILIVDDASPDGTGAIADQLAADHPEVEVLHRCVKDGLGRAYVSGFNIAMAGGAERVIQMDADFSHDPADLPRLLAAARSADVVIGSRYVRGGGVRDWGRTRRLLSRGGSAYARLVLGVPVRDLTGGFKVISCEVLRRIDLNQVRAQGYVFQIEVTYRAALCGFRVTEIPIVFRDRQLGRSRCLR